MWIGVIRVEDIALLHERNVENILDKTIKKFEKADNEMLNEETKNGKG